MHRHLRARRCRQGPLLLVLRDQGLAVRRADPFDAPTSAACRPSAMDPDANAVERIRRAAVASMLYLSEHPTFFAFANDDSVSPALAQLARDGTEVYIQDAERFDPRGPTHAAMRSMWLDPALAAIGVSATTRAFSELLRSGDGERRDASNWRPSPATGWCGRCRACDVLSGWAPASPRRQLESSAVAAFMPVSRSSRVVGGDARVLVAARSSYRYVPFWLFAVAYLAGVVVLFAPPGASASCSSGCSGDVRARARSGPCCRRGAPWPRQRRTAEPLHARRARCRRGEHVRLWWPPRRRVVHAEAPRRGGAGGACWPTS